MDVEVEGVCGGRGGIHIEVGGGGGVVNIIEVERGEGWYTYRGGGRGVVGVACVVHSFMCALSKQGWSGIILLYTI